jgi:hypothetical protein
VTPRSSRERRGGSSLFNSGPVGRFFPGPVVFVAVLAAGCGQRPPAAATARAVDCLGPDSIVAIDAGKIGDLPLTLPVDSIRRRCANVRDTTAHGDETLDTAIVITRPGLTVVGRIATVADGDGFHPVRLDSSSRVMAWQVKGSAGRLPGGVRLDGTWRDLSVAYGRLLAFALNGTVYVTICSRPRLGVLMREPQPGAPINSINGEPSPAATVDSVMATTRIESVIVPSTQRSDSTQLPKC